MLIFKNKREVVEYLDDLVDKGLLAKSDDGGYYQTGDHVCNHGEVDRPDFYPTRYSSGWGIALVNHYLPGTCNAPPKRARVEVWSEEDVEMGSTLQYYYS